MRDKFFRAQQFVYRHRGTFGYAAGIGVACATILTMKNKPYTLAVYLQESPEKIAKMLTESGGLEIITEKGSKVLLFPGTDFARLP